MKIGIIHQQTGAAGAEIERDLALRPDQFAILNRQMVDGESKNLFQRSLLGDVFDRLDDRNIRRSVRSDGDVHNRMLERQRVKSELRPQKRYHLDVCDQVIGMG